MPADWCDRMVAAHDRIEAAGAGHFRFGLECPHEAPLSEAHFEVCEDATWWVGAWWRYRWLEVGRQPDPLAGVELLAARLERVVEVVGGR